MPETITYTGELVVVTCWCGIKHAVPSDLRAYQLHHRSEVFCPLGHGYVPRTKSLEKQLDAARQELRRAWQRVDAERDLRNAEERSHAATKGHLTRHRRRTAAGVCPCCNRTFQNLSQHMHSEHPDQAR